MSSATDTPVSKDFVYICYPPSVSTFLLSSTCGEVEVLEHCAAGLQGRRDVGMVRMLWRCEGAAV